MTANGSEAYVGGTLNLAGVRPGGGFTYDGPTMPKMVFFGLTFTSTYEAIERLILPPPLKVDRDLPPEVQVLFFVSPGNRAFDGRLTPYQGFLFTGRTTHGELRGRAGWEYVDGLHGDKTAMDVMGPWGVYFGMLKKLADIRCVPVGVNEFEISVTRRGTRLATMRFSLGSELPDAAVEAINVGAAEFGSMLTVREIPDVKFENFVDRAICASAGDANRVTRAWSAHGGSLEFGHLELDPLDELPVLSIGDGIVFEADSDKAAYSQLKILEHLSRTAGEQVPGEAALTR